MGDQANEEILDFTSETPATLSTLASALGDLKSNAAQKVHVISNGAPDLVAGLNSVVDQGFNLTDNSDGTFEITVNPDFVYTPPETPPVPEQPDPAIAQAAAEQLALQQQQQEQAAAEQLAQQQAADAQAAQDRLAAKKGDIERAANQLLSGESVLVGTTLTLDDIEAIGLPPLIIVDSVAANGVVTLGKKKTVQEQKQAGAVASDAGVNSNDDEEVSEYEPDSVEYFLEQKYTELRKTGIPRFTKDLIARLREYVTRMGKNVPVQTERYGAEQHIRLIQIYSEALAAKNGEYRLALEAILWFFHKYADGAFKDTMLMRFHPQISTAPARLTMFRRLNNFFASVADPATRAVEVARQNMDRVAKAMLSDEHTVNLLDFFKPSK